MTARVLVPTAIIMALFTVVGAALTYVAVHAVEAQKLRAELVVHANERANRESRRFDDLAALQMEANRAFAQSLRSFDRERVDAEFDELFPLKADGTRRSSDALHDGYAPGDGSHIYGVAAFIPNGRNLSRDEKLELMAALRVVSGFGDAASFRFENFFFYTPENRAIIFSPKQPERLEFYRHKAPAHFSVAFDDMTQMTLPSANPDGDMRCTRPQPPLYDSRSPNWTIGCLTPARVDGEHAGAWGVALRLDQLIGHDADGRLPGTEHMMLTGDGKLLAHRFRTAAGVERAQGYLDIARSGDGRLSRAAQLADSARTRTRVAYHAEDDHFIAAAPLRGPDWRFVVMADGGDVRRRAAEVTLKTLALVIAGSTGILLMLRQLLVTQVSRPLTQMVEAVDRERSRALVDREPLSHSLPVRRRDEIGALARRMARIEDPPPSA